MRINRYRPTKAAEHRTVYVRDYRRREQLAYKNIYFYSRRGVFSKRQRITLRLLYAIAIPSVVCRLSVCLSVVCL